MAKKKEDTLTDPKITHHDGAALYWIWGSGVATPANSAFDGTLNFIWN